MSGAGRRCLWLTALATATFTISGCNGTAGHQPDANAAHARARSSTSSPRHASPSTTSPRPTHPVPPPPQSTPLGRASVSPTTLPAVALPRDPGVVVVSDGSSTVQVGGRRVAFPGPVTDATVSPNGTVIAYVDGRGNIATAHLDGTGVNVLTSTDPGVRRAQPTFEDGGSEIIFSERGHDGVWRLKEVAADGHDQLAAGKADPTLRETRHDDGHDTAPSATWFQASHDQVARSVLVFQHETTKGVARVYIADRNQRGFGAAPLLPGKAPAVSPAGDRVAFIAPNGQIDLLHLPVLTRTPHPTQITWGAHPVGHLAWSPDGRTLAFSTRRGVESVAAQPPAPHRNPATVVTRHPGVVSIGQGARPSVGVYSDPDPVATALRVSRAHFVSGRHAPTDEGSSFGVDWPDHVTLVSTDDPSAAGVAAAVAHGGPVLFLRHGRLGSRVRNEIERLLNTPRFAPPGHVDIVADPGAVPSSVDAAVGSLGFKVERFDPSSASSDRASAYRDSQAYVLVSRTDLPAIVASAGTDAPVLLTDDETMPASTAHVLSSVTHYRGHPATVYAVGMQAQAAVRSAWPGKPPKLRIVDVGGADPSANSLAAAQGLYDSPGRVAVAPAGGWADELIASMIGPTLVVDETHGLERSAQAWLSASEPVLRGVYVVGGSLALPETLGRAVYGHRFRVVDSPRDVVSSSELVD